MSEGKGQSRKNERGNVERIDLGRFMEHQEFEAHMEALGALTSLIGVAEHEIAAVSTFGLHTLLCSWRKECERIVYEIMEGYAGTKSADGDAKQAGG
jgi:hypothetical protein